MDYEGHSTWTRSSVRRLFPDITEKMSDNQLDDFIDEMLDPDEPAGPVFARAVDNGTLPIIAIILVAAASVFGMLLAVWFYMPKELT